MWKRKYRGREVAVKVLKRYANSDLQKITHVSHWRCSHPGFQYTRTLTKLVQRFCKEFVTWKALRHPNVLPLLGVIMSETQFAMVSDWMPNGNINEFVRKHPDANRFELVSSPFSFPPPPLVVDGYIIHQAWRSREGLDLFARSRDGPRGSQRSTFSEPGSFSISNGYLRPIFLSMKLATPAWQTLVCLRSYQIPQATGPRTHLHMEAHSDG